MDECSTAFILLKGFWLFCRNETKQGFSGQLKNPSDEKYYLSCCGGMRIKRARGRLVIGKEEKPRRRSS
jgi:hypothetical protein